MQLFKKPAEEFVPYTDAQRYRDNGYQPLCVERYYASQGPHWATPDAWEQPRGGGHAWGLPTPPANDIANWIVSIQAGILPRAGSRSLTEASATWLACIRVDNPGSKRAARDIESLAPGALIRTDVDNGDLLLVFRMASDVYDARAFGFRQGRVRCLGNDVFLASSPRHAWGERSPATVGRDELPALNWNGARDLVASIDGMLNARAA
jgi:hypothetical protein